VLDSEDKTRLKTRDGGERMEGKKRKKVAKKLEKIEDVVETTEESDEDEDGEKELKPESDDDMVRVRSAGTRGGRKKLAKSLRQNFAAETDELFDNNDGQSDFPWVIPVRDHTEEELEVYNDEEDSEVQNEEGDIDSFESEIGTDTSDFMFDEGDETPEEEPSEAEDFGGVGGSTPIFSHTSDLYTQYQNRKVTSDTPGIPEIEVLVGYKGKRRGSRALHRKVLTRSLTQKFPLILS
jgi:hypothetical protein